MRVPARIGQRLEEVDTPALVLDLDAFERNLDDVDACARSYVTDPAAYEKIEASPYVATGQGPWAPDFRAGLTDALTVAAGTGG